MLNTVWLQKARELYAALRRHRPQVPGLDVRKSTLKLEVLEARCLLTAGLIEFDVPWSPPPTLYGIESLTLGSDGNYWFTKTLNINIDKISPTGTVTELDPSSWNNESVIDIVGGPNGNLWFASTQTAEIGRLTTSGTATLFPLPEGARADLLTPGLDGNMWFSDYTNGKIGDITPSGVVTEFLIPSQPNGLSGLAYGPDGNIWFAEHDAHKIGKLSPGGVVSEYALSNYAYPSEIVAGSDGNLWFTDLFNSPYDQHGRIGRIKPDGTITEFDLVLDGGAFSAVSLRNAPDGNLYFETGGGLGRITTTGTVTILERSFALGQLVIQSQGPDLAVWGIDRTQEYTAGGGPPDPTQGKDRIARLIISDSPPIVVPDSISAVGGQPFSGEAAQFTYTSLSVNNAVEYFAATINWGDGTSSAGTVSEISGTVPLSVSGTHTYAASGTYTPTLTISPTTPGSGSGSSSGEGNGSTGPDSGGVPEADPNALFVEQLYRDLLGRFADIAGEKAWIAELGQGFQPSAIVQGFLNSLEYRTRVVEGMYQSLLGRQAEPYGLGFWLNFLNTNHTVEQMEAGFLGSPEYSQLHAGTSSQAFLAAMYHDVFGRAADPSGLAFWSASLTFGISRADVAFAMLTSDEAVEGLVHRSYEQYLHRPADPSGLASFVKQIKQGMTDQSLIVALDGSDEFFSYFH